MLPSVKIYAHGDIAIAIKLTAFSATVVKALQTIPSCKWDPVTCAWIVGKSHHLDILAVMAEHKIPHTLEAGIAASVRIPTDSVSHILSDNRPLSAEEAVSWDTLEYSPKTKSYDHQMRATILAVRRLKFGFFMEQGTGKTKGALDALFCLMQKKVIHGALIFVPKCVLINWEREIEMHSPLSKEQSRALVVTGTAAKKKEQLEYAYNARVPFVISNYESLRELESMFLQLLMDKPMGILCDESAKIKNHAALHSRALHRLRHKAPVRFILTGTPIANDPLDLFSQFLFLDENILGHHNFYSFKNEYARTGGYRGREVVGYRNLDRLAEKIAPWSYRVLKKDCLDLPEKLYKTVELEMSATQANLYEQMRKESILELDGFTLDAPIVMTRLLRLQQITSGFIPKIDEFGKDVGVHRLDGVKVAAIVELVEAAHASEQKVIIWTRFTEELLSLVSALPSGVVSYYGGSSDKERQLSVDRFQNDKNAKTFVGQIAAGGMGITLTAASLVIYASNSFSLNDRLQSEDRAHRIGQVNKVEYVDVICRNTVDGYILKALKDKKDVADVVTGDKLRQILEMPI